MFLLQATVLQSNGSATQDIISPITSSPFLQRVYLDLKIIFIIYTVILFVAMVLVVFNARPKKIKKQVEEVVETVLREEAGPEEYGGKWQEILKLLEGKEESSWRQAVIEADKFFDDIMRRLGYSGDSFSERLKQIHETEIQNLDAVWDAHRVRNSISHDLKFKVTRDDARRAVGAYEKAMKDLDVM